MDPATKSQPAPARKQDPDFLTHLEVYLAKRDGVDKLLKISRYAAKILLASSALPETLTLTRRLRSFESSIGLSRKAFRLGKFVQDVNALRGSHLDSREEILLAVVAYGGEGIYYFVEQLVWLSKTGMIGDSHARALGRVSAWAELVGYVGSISIKLWDLRKLERDEACLASSIEIAVVRGVLCRAEEHKLREVRLKKLLKRLSVVQDMADAFMAVADIRDGKGMLLSSPLLVACAGLLSALISTHKNWNSC